MVKPGAAMYIEYAKLFQTGETLSRRQVADRMGVPYTTALYNLERAVDEGLLQKAVVWTKRNSTGWGYYLVHEVEDMF
jgi:transposase